MRLFRLAPVFLCKTPFATALSTVFVASLINFSNSATFSSVADGNNTSANVRTFLMRVAISDFLALLYVRCFWVRMVRATLFCFASTWNWKPETTPPGFAVDDAKAALEPVFFRERERES